MSAELTDETPATINTTITIGVC